MRPARIVALVIGCVLALPTIALLFGGGALGVGYAFARDDDGYFEVTLDRLETDTVAIGTEDLDLATDPASPDWVIDALDADVRLRVTNADTARPVFVGIGPEASIDRYLAGVAHAVVTEIDDDLEATYRTSSGGDAIAIPTDQNFWVASASAVGTAQLDWEAVAGRWSVVIMNADGSPGVATDVDVGVKVGFLVPLMVIMLAAGTILAVIAIVLIVVGARHRPEPEVQPVGTPAPAVAGVHPVRFTAKLEPGLSRWMWLVKWILAIPHIVVLVLLWIAFGVLTFFAAVAILFTGRYPKGIFDFNVGVLRWSWRVAHYASTGGIGSDRYPPFTLEPTPDDAVTLDITYPERLSRPLVLVKWLLAIPHLLIVGLLNGTSWTWWPDDWGRFGFDFGGGGMLGLLTLAAGVVLLFTNTYPKGLYDFIVGLNRWTVRTVAYVALMTDEYPPFRLDQGETEPDPDMAGGPVGYPEPPPVVDATV